LHPIWGLAILLGVMFCVFQAVFSWAQLPVDLIKHGFDAMGAFIGQHMPEGLLKSFIIDAMIGGLGAVLQFLPQILILFFFILSLEESGYLPRAAFLLDGMMSKLGLSGRSFIPLLSSFACAIPGIMATRSIHDKRDRLTTILIAPLMTCSARLPVYTLLISAFIPARAGWGLISLQGAILFGLYIAGILGAVLVALVLKLGRKTKVEQALLMELPSYRRPSLQGLAIGLLERAQIFMKRITGIIFAVNTLLWFLTRFPLAPVGGKDPAITYSFAGFAGKVLAHIFAPIGFNWQICVALIPGLAAREVAVSALGTVYAVSGSEEQASTALGQVVAHQWSLATAMSLLAWYVFAPQCFSTLTVIKRETGSWRFVALTAGYLFAMAYAASFITYHLMGGQNL